MWFKPVLISSPLENISQEKVVANSLVWYDSHHGEGFKFSELLVITHWLIGVFRREYVNMVMTFQTCVTVFLGIILKVIEHFFHVYRASS